MLYMNEPNKGAEMDAKVEQFIHEVEARGLVQDTEA